MKDDCHSSEIFPLSDCCVWIWMAENQCVSRPENQCKYDPMHGIVLIIMHANIVPTMMMMFLLL